MPVERQGELFVQEKLLVFFSLCLLKLILAFVAVELFALVLSLTFSRYRNLANLRSTCVCVCVFVFCTEYLELPSA